MRSSVPSKGIDTLYNGFSPREKQPLPKDNLMVDRYVSMQRETIVPSPPKSAEKEAEEKSKPRGDEVVGSVDISIVREDRRPPAPEKPSFVPPAIEETKQSTPAATSQTGQTICDKLFQEVTMGLFGATQSKTYRSAALIGDPSRKPQLSSPQAKTAATIPKYANFESIGESDRTVTYAEARRLSPSPRAPGKRKEGGKENLLMMHVAPRGEKEEQMVIKLRLRAPLLNQGLYEQLPLLDIHAYDADTEVRKLKTEIGNIFSQLEQLSAA